MRHRVEFQSFKLVTIVNNNDNDAMFNSVELPELLESAISSSLASWCNSANKLATVKPLLTPINPI